MAIFNTLYVNTSSEAPIEYEWWSPKMKSDSSPPPFIVSASSTFGSHSPYKAFDDDSSTLWSSTNTSNSWIQFDFGAKTVIAGVRFLAATPYEQNFPRSFTISGSDDNSTFFEILNESLTESTSPTNTDWLEYEFSKVNYRYYRITSTGLSYNANYYFSVASIEFYISQ